MCGFPALGVPNYCHWREGLLKGTTCEDLLRALEGVDL